MANLKTAAIIILIAIAFLITLTDFVEAQVSAGTGTAPARKQPDSTTTDRRPVTPSGQICRPLVLPKRHFQLDWSDGVYWGGSVADIASSSGLREANPFLRGPDGQLSIGKALAFKGGLWGALKFLDYWYPEHRRAMRITKAIVGGAFIGAAIHNSRINR